MALFVNADDYGKNSSVNKAVCEAFENKYITSTTLMMNMPGVDEAYELAVKNGYADRVGIHLNITEGIPITNGIKNNPLICSPDGSFNAAFYHNTKYRLYMDRQSIDQIRDEIDAQISRFLEMGFKKLHIDSHHHVHTNYPVFCAIKELKVKYDYDYIRLSRNLYRKGNFLNTVYKFFYNYGVRRLAKESVDYFGSYEDLVAYLVADNVKVDKYSGDAIKAMEKLVSEKDIEIMVHPFYNKGGILMDTDLPMQEERYLAIGKD
ncbi:MAG: ChbG/HpnK family deacetylase [Lachnospiraceae bacterium]|nr:ChbG/HpnK family deacetylase [Lachnospiraceae bacterium]